jgi:serine protease Do
MTTKWMCAVALLVAGAVTPFTWAQNPAPRAPGAVVMGGGYLGVGVLDVDTGRAKALKLKEERGVEITSVTEGGPADKAGIKPGDVVLEYNRQPVEGMAQFQRLVRETPAGRQVKVQVWRNGAAVTLTAAVEARKGFTLVTPDMDMEGLAKELDLLKGKSLDLQGKALGLEAKALAREAAAGQLGQEMQMPRMPPFDMPNILVITPSRRLGIEGEALGEEPQFAEFLGVKEGVLVKSVLKNSAAEKAGIKAGDVITRIGDARVFNSQDITTMLRANRHDQTFTVTVVRNKKEMPVTVTIEDRTGRNQSRAAAQC